MKSNLALGILLTFFCFKMSAQLKRVEISGKISGDSIALENIHIINKTSKKATTSNSNGNFRISVKENDELLISSIKYKNKVIHINNMHIKSLNILITLEKEIYSLDEVTIEKRRNIAGDLGLPNANKKPLTNLENRLNAHSKASLPLTILYSFIGGAGGIDNLYYIISGDRKKDRKLASLLQRDKIEAIEKQERQNIRIRLTDNFFTKTLKIPLKEIDNFIQFCDDKNIDYLLSKNRTLEVIDIFIKESPHFLKILKEKK